MQAIITVVGVNLGYLGIYLLEGQAFKSSNIYREILLILQHISRSRLS